MWCGVDAESAPRGGSVEARTICFSGVAAKLLTAVMIPKQGGVQLVQRRTSRGSPVVTWSWCWKCSPWRIHWSADCFFLRCGRQTFLSLIPTFLSFLHRCVCSEITPNGAAAFLIFKFNKVGMYSSSPWRGE